MNILYKWLQHLLNKKKHDVVKLKWQKAELESLVSKARSEQR